MGVNRLPGEGRRLMMFMPGIENGGGAERYAVSVALVARSMGFEVALATGAGVTRPWLDQHFGVDSEGIELFPLPAVARQLAGLPQALFDLLEDVRWARRVRSWRPDVFVNGLYRSQLPALGGAANVALCHFPHQLTATYRPWWRDLFMRAVAAGRRGLLGGVALPAGYDEVVANSAFTADHVWSRWARHATVIHPACQQLGLEGGERSRRIMSVGRFEPPKPGVPNKRMDLMVEVFSSLTDLHRQGWELHLAGVCSTTSSVYVDDLRRRAGDAPVIIHTNLAHADLRRLYNTATFYWHAQGAGESSTLAPEAQEHFGITTVEAMSAGVIPIVIDTAGPQEVVAPVAGLPRWQTADELADLTRRLVGASAEVQHDLADRCRVRAQDFTEQVFADRWRSLLSSLAAGEGAVR